MPFVRSSFVLRTSSFCLLAVGSPVRGEGPIVLRDVTARRRASPSATRDGGSGRHYIVETVASGVATFDYDGDGWIDIYFLNGRPVARHAGRRGAAQRACTATWAASASPM